MIKPFIFTSSSNEEKGGRLLDFFLLSTSNLTLWLQIWLHLQTNRVLTSLSAPAKEPYSQTFYQLNFKKLCTFCLPAFLVLNFFGILEYDLRLRLFFWKRLLLQLLSFIWLNFPIYLNLIFPMRIDSYHILEVYPTCLPNYYM